MLPGMTIEQLTAAMSTATTAADADRLRAALVDLKVKDLRALAATHRVAVGSKDSKATLVSRISWQCFGGRLASLAIEGRAKGY